MKNFGEKEAWAYVSRDCPIFWYPLLSQEPGKLRISNFACTFMGSIGTKARLKFGESSRGRYQGLRKFSGQEIHRAVIFAIAQLSCLLTEPKPTRWRTSWHQGQYK